MRASMLSSRSGAKMLLQVARQDFGNVPVVKHTKIINDTFSDRKTSV